MNELSQCELPEKPKGKIIEVDMHYCDKLIINCHDHDGKTTRKIFETKTVFLPNGVTSCQKSSGFMYHKLQFVAKAEQEEFDDEILFRT